MYTAHDGKNFGNHEMGKHYDATRPKKKAESDEGGGEHEQDMDGVVAEHGPAEHVEIHSHHADGHVHHATHHDAHSAHEHVSKAFDEGEESEGEHEAEEPEAEPVGDDGGMPSIPGMR